jgi:hypothetical protein
MRILAIILTMLLMGCVTTGNYHPERRHECEVESQLQAQTFWGSGETASAMAILNYFNCMSSD